VPRRPRDVSPQNAPLVKGPLYVRVERRLGPLRDGPFGSREVLRLNSEEPLDDCLRAVVWGAHQTLLSQT